MTDRPEPWCWLVIERAAIDGPAGLRCELHRAPQDIAEDAIAFFSSMTGRTTWWRAYRFAATECECDTRGSRLASNLPNLKTLFIEALPAGETRPSTTTGDRIRGPINRRRW